MIASLAVASGVLNAAAQIRFNLGPGPAGAYWLIQRLLVQAVGVTNVTMFYLGTQLVAWAPTTLRSLMLEGMPPIHAPLLIRLQGPAGTPYRVELFGETVVT